MEIFAILFRDRVVARFPIPPPIPKARIYIRAFLMPAESPTWAGQALPALAICSPFAITNALANTLIGYSCSQ